MNGIRHFLKRHPAWVAAVLAILPLVLLFRLQYTSLTQLERTSGIARQATLQNYLEALANEFEYGFKTHAERLLNVPASHFTESMPEKSAYLFRKKGTQGARHIFVANYAMLTDDNDVEELFIFDAINWEEPASPEERRAVLVALAPWKVMAQRGIPLPTVPLAVDERDPENRMILNPITVDSLVVGVAGMILDNDYFKEELLGGTIENSLEQLYGADLSQALLVTVRDEQGHLVYGKSVPEWLLEHQEVRRGFNFVFTDWTLGLRNVHATEGDWARSNFFINLSLSALLSVVLLGGLIMALRTVARETKLNQMKTNFVSNVSHELRTPLASIRVFAEFLRLGRAHEPAKAIEYGEYIETESRRLTQLISNILDFAKIESGSKTYEFVTGDLEDVLTECLRTLGVRLNHSGHTVEYHSPSGGVPQVRMDPHAMVQAFCNILENAAKYSADASVIHVTLTVRRREVVIAVRDEGVGIARAEQSRIFERFHRVHTDLVHDVKGSGLGLSIVKHIVDAHGGRITVDSATGKGSTFSIHLPVLAEHRLPDDGGAERQQERPAAGPATDSPAG